MPVLAVRGGAGGPGAKSVRLSRPPGALLFEHQLGRGFWMGIGGPVGPTGHRGREAIAPWSLPWKTGEARLARPSSLPLTGPSRLLPSLARQDARRDPQKSRRGDPGVWLSSSRRAGATQLLFFLGPRQPCGAGCEGRSRSRSRRDGEGGAGERSAGQGGRRMRTRRPLGRGRRALTGSGNTAACWVSVRQWWAAR